MTSSEVNSELLLGFLDESIDALNAVDGLFIKLETNPSDIEIVNEIFRPVHSLKGNAAYFGLMELKKLAHTIENLLDQIRNGKCHVNRAIIDCILPGIDTLRTMLNEVRNGREEISDEKSFKRIISKIDSILNNSDSFSSEDTIQRITDIIGKLHSHITNDDGKQLLEMLNELLKSVSLLSNTKNASPAAMLHNQNGLQGKASELYALLCGDRTKYTKPELTKLTSELLAQLREQNSNNSSASNTIYEISDIFETFTHTDTGLDDLAIELMIDKLTELKSDEQLNDSNTTQNNKQDPTVTKTSAEHKPAHDKTMRIPEQSLDDFLKCVGELLGIEETLRHLTRQLNTGADTYVLSTNMKEAVGQFEAISKELRSKIMEVRKVEAKILLQKTPRIVRDIASLSGKQISVEMIGEEIRIDKSYIDLLDAPLTHMVRNAADHGIENLANRVAKGKPQEGKITVSIVENTDYLQLIIKDDGAGINYDALQKKALSLGIVEKNATLSQNDIIDLLFQSGVSTASQVTEISGRGVGMDIVKRAVIDAGGRIEVSSIPDTGTTFTVSVPRNASTQIFDGYMVRSFSEEMYVLPLGNVVEAFSIQEKEISSVAEIGKVLSRRGAVFPLHSLDSLLGFKVESDTSKVSDLMGVLIELKGKKVVLSVKNIVGIQKVVSKPIEGSILDNELFDGAAISGTGNISMILNIEKLLKI